MAVRIRLKQMGRTHRHCYRIVAIDHRQPRDGAEIEELGTYDPHIKEKSDRVTLKPSRIKYWQSVGAQPSGKCTAIFKKFMKKWEAIEEAGHQKFLRDAALEIECDENNLCNVVTNRGIRQTGGGLAFVIAQTPEVEYAITEKMGDSRGDRRSVEKVQVQVPMSTTDRSRGESPTRHKRDGLVMFPNAEHADLLVRQFRDASLPAFDRMSALVALESADHDRMYDVAVSALIAGVTDPHLAAALLRTVEWAPSNILDRDSPTARKLAWALVSTVKKVSEATGIEDQEHCLASGYRTFSILATPRLALELESHIQEEHRAQSQMAFDAICVIFTRSDPTKAKGIESLRDRVDEYIAAGRVGQVEDATVFGHYVTAVCAAAVLGGEQFAQAVNDLAQRSDWREKYLLKRIAILREKVRHSDWHSSVQAERIDLLLATHKG